MDEAALTAACLATPEENTPRLMLADWLEEFGTTERQKAQMEWIRLTCFKSPRKYGIRQAGEPAWLGANTHRLFPVLHKHMHGMQLLSGSFRISTWIPNGVNPLKVTSIVHLRGERGPVGCCGLPIGEDQDEYSIRDDVR